MVRNRTGQIKYYVGRFSACMVSRMKTNKSLKINAVYIRKQSISVVITHLWYQSVRHCTLVPLSYSGGRSGRLTSYADTLRMAYAADHRCSYANQVPQRGAVASWSWGLLKLASPRVAYRAIAALLCMAGSQTCPRILGNAVSRAGLEPVEPRQQVAYLGASRGE